MNVQADQALRKLNLFMNMPAVGKLARRERDAAALKAYEEYRSLSVSPNEYWEDAELIEQRMAEVDAMDHDEARERYERMSNDPVFRPAFYEESEPQKPNFDDFYARSSFAPKEEA